MSVTEYAELPLIPTTGQDMARERGRLRGAGAKLGPKPQAWVVQYRRRAVQVDLAARAAAAALGIAIRFGDEPRSTYVLLGATMPFAWLGLVFLVKGYERRFLGTGTEEYRSLTRAAVGLLAVIALISYAWQLELARGFVLLACPAVLTFDLLGRWLLRRWLKRQRMAGRCMQRTVVVGRAELPGRSDPRHPQRPEPGPEHGGCLRVGTRLALERGEPPRGRAGLRPAGSRRCTRSTSMTPTWSRSPATRTSSDRHCEGLPGPWRSATSSS